MCRDLLRLHWGIVELNGVSGNAQNGVDVYANVCGLWYGAQCKNTASLTAAQVRNEVEKARGFDPMLSEYVILTTVGRSARLQEDLRNLDAPFKVSVLFWEDLELLLCDDLHTLKKYYGTLLSTPEAPYSQQPANDSAGDPPGKAAEEFIWRQVVVVSVVVRRSDGVKEEVWAEAADRLLDDISRLLQRYQATPVVRGADQLTVVFGVPLAGDRQTHRAIDAALSVRLASSRGRTLSLTIGVNSGRMLFSSEKHRHLPSRLLVSAEALARSAPAGAVVISQEVERELRDDYSVEPILPEMHTWKVTGRVDHDEEVERRGRSRLTPFVGREAQFDQLKTTWRQAEESIGSFVVVRGDLGMGKSRLMRELRDHVRQRGGRVLTATCFEQHQLSPFYPGVSLAMKSFGIKPNDDALERRQKLATSLQNCSVDVEQDVAVFGELLALNASQPYTPLDFAPQAKRELILETFVRVFKALATAQPTLVIVEDAHWSDPSTLAFIRRLTASPSRHLMVVATCRPNLADLGDTVIRLERMRVKELEGMVGHIVRDRSIEMTRDERARLIRRAAGNPLFLEELLRCVSAHDDGEVVPGNVVALLQARIVNRQPRALRVAQVAAALGTRFSTTLLAQGADLSREDLTPILEELEIGEVVVRRSTDEAEFSHVLLRDAAYGTMPEQQRARIHERIYAALGQPEHTTFVERYPEVLGRHAFLAGRFTEAARAYARAARRAAKRPAYDEAMRFIDEGLELASKGDARESRSCELELRVLRGVVLASQNGYAHRDVAETYVRALKLVEKTEDSDRPPLFHALRGLWAYFALRADLRRARTISARLRRLTDEAVKDRPVPDMELESLRTMGTVDYYEGHFGRAYQLLRNVEPVYSRAESTRYTELYGQDPLVVALSYAALSSVIMGEVDRGRDEADRAIRLAREVNHPFTLAMCLVFVCIAFQLRGDEERASDLASEAIAMSNERGFALWRAMASMVAGWASTNLDRDVDKGVARILAGLEAHQRTGGLLGVPYFRYLQLHRALTMEREPCAPDLQECEMALQNAFEAARTTNENWMTAELHRMAGRLAELRRQFESAETCYFEAARFADRQQARLFELRARVDQARVWLRLGRERAAAVALVDGAVARFRPGADTQDLREARAWLSTQHGPRATGEVS